MLTEQTRRISQFRSHFVRDTAPHSLDLIHVAAGKFNKTSLDASCSLALQKLASQTTAQDIRKDDKVNNFLNQDFQDTNEYQALAAEYTTLQKLQERPHITAYIKLAERSIKATRDKFERYLAEQKRQFNAAYEAVCTDQHKRDALWKRYEKSLKTKMLGPVDNFAHDISHDRLLSQSMIHYLNRLSDNSTATYQNGTNDEEFIQQSVYIDSKEMPINVQYDKKTGKATEIRVNPLTPSWFPISTILLPKLFAKLLDKPSLAKPISGDFGDAFAIMVASHGKDIPIKIVVPISQSDYLRSEMEPGFTQLLALLFHWCAKKMEQTHYKNRIVEAAVEKGIHLDNISLVDSQGQPLVFSPKLKVATIAKIKEWEDKFAKFETKLEAKEEEEKLKKQTQFKELPQLIAGM